MSRNTKKSPKVDSGVLPSDAPQSKTVGVAEVSFVGLRGMVARSLEEVSTLVASTPRSSAPRQHWAS